MLIFFIIMVSLELVALVAAYKVWQREKQILKEMVRKQEMNQKLQEKFREIDRKNEEAIRFAHAGMTPERLKFHKEWKAKEKELEEALQREKMLRVGK